MFCVVYKFYVDPAKHEQFKEGWRAVTMALKAECGGLGSRLHQDQNGNWIAYAQWPDKATWEKSGGVSADAERGRKLMMDSFRSGGLKPEVVYMLDVVEDLIDRDWSC